MNIIERDYSKDFYFWPIDKERRHVSVLKWESADDQPIVVFHPFLHFDPLSNLDRQKDMMARDGDICTWEFDGIYKNLEGIYDPIEDRLTPIVHEEIRANINFFQSLDSFLRKIEHHFKLKAGQQMWIDTGYWAARDSKYGYMGISEENAMRLWNQSKELRMCYIASIESLLLEFYLDKGEANSFSLSVYYTNKYLVFPDMIDAVHKALDDVGDWKTIKIENKDHDDIFAINYKNKRSMEKQYVLPFSIKPKWVMPLGNNPRPGTDLLYAVVAENTFFKIENRMKKPEGYAILTRHGGWISEDFQEDKKYQTYSNIRKLEHCYLVNLVVQGIVQDYDNLGIFH